jgi:nucleoside-diphosphate-sugar epimerase
VTDVLVTGAAGFLGRHFAEWHLRKGDEVIMVDDLSSPYAQWPLSKAQWQLREDAGAYLDDWDFGIVTPEIVYHFAAPVRGREQIEHDPFFNADSLRLDASLFRWAIKAKPRVIVYPSSSAVYALGFQTERLHVPLTERHFHPDGDWHHPDEMYGFTKMVGEILAWRAAAFGVNTLCIRPFSGYGEDQSPEYPMPSIIARVKKRQDPLIVWGPGNQSRDFIHVDDVVAATVKRVEAGVEGYAAMNIGTGIPTSFERLAQRAAWIASYRPVIECLEDKPYGVMHRYCDPTEMLKYHVPQVSLTEGIKRMLDG